MPCESLLLPPTVPEAVAAGQERCLMVETPTELSGRRLVRVDVGISGKAPGFSVKGGPRAEYFTDAPEFVYPQVGNPGPVLPAVAHYEADKGTAVIVVFPREARDWNGKMYVTAHGGSRAMARGNLKAWNANLDPANPVADLSAYERLMLTKGYALAKTRRSTDGEGRDVVVILSDGTAVTRNITEHSGVLLGMALVAENLLEARLGRKPERTYWYGRSAGARPGRLVNYQRGRNRGADGSPIIDGILADDSGAGLWLPVAHEQERDVLFATAADRAAFVPQIDIHHLLYVNETDDAPPDWVSRNYLENKRRNAILLRRKGLGAKHRAYEVHGVSHISGEDDEITPKGEVRFLPLWKVMDAAIDLLDDWVARGIEPPPSRSDSALLGDEGGDGVVDHPAIALPEVACPLGVFYQYPAGGGAAGAVATGFARFDGEGLEPIDGRGVFVDMNRNWYRDRREPLSSAWQRMGLLPGGGTVTLDAYTACVRRSVDALRGQRLLSAPVADAYLSEASAWRPAP